MKALLKIFTILTPRQIRNCVVLVLLMLFSAVLETVGIGALYPLIKVISDPNILDKHAHLAHIVALFGVKTHEGLIIFCSAGLIGFYAFKNAYIVMQNRLQLRFSSNLQKTFVTRMFALYLYKPYLYHINTISAVRSRNAVGYGDAIFLGILWQTLMLITEMFTVIVVWSLIYAMNWMIAIFIALVMGPLAVFILKTFKKKLVAQNAIQKAAMVEYGKWTGQGFGSIKETKVMQIEKYIVENFRRAYFKYSDSSKYSKYIGIVPRSIVEMMGMGGILLLIIGAMLIKIKPEDLIPTLGVLAVAATRLMPCTTRIMASFNTIKFNLPHLDEIYDDLMVVRRKQDAIERGMAEKETVKMPFKKEIVVDNLSFRYPNTNVDVLDGVSFTIPKSAFVGIVGPSGAGKTTFVDVLLGLLPPTAGCIKVDGKDVYSDIPGWLKNIAYVQQRIHFIDGSVRDNVAIGVSEADFDAKRLEKALKMADLWDFAQTMPDGVDTWIGEDGGHLSGGQKQRIGIARALYREPDVLILDEATSSLDNETEKSITSTILKLKKSITIISIAHRLSTLADCDFKIRFKDGKAAREE